MSLSLTDAPACGYEHVYVTVDKVRVHQSTMAGDQDAGWQEVVVSPAKRIDLLNLTNGILEHLGQTALPAGSYTQMRLVLAPNTSAPWANAAVLAGTTQEIKLDTPSAAQSGLKMNVNITVEPDQTADFVIDFDACKSVVKAGNSGKHNLKPVLSVIPNLSGQIIGYVDPGLALTSTQVSVQTVVNGEVRVVKATHPAIADDPANNLLKGQFVLSPVPLGTGYHVVITAPGTTTGVITGVPVSSTSTPTVIGSPSVLLSLPPSATHVASGKVSIDGSTADTYGSVQVIQTLYDSPKVVVADGPVDGETGAYAYSLPIAAPLKLAYAPNLTSLVWNADSADPTLTAAGKYTLLASIPVPEKSAVAVVDLLTGDKVTDFAFTTP